MTDETIYFNQNGDSELHEIRDTLVDALPDFSDTGDRFPFDRVERDKFDSDLFVVYYDPLCKTRSLGTYYGRQLLDAGYVVFGIHTYDNDEEDDDRVSHLTLKKIK